MEPWVKPEDDEAPKRSC